MSLRWVALLCAMLVGVSSAIAHVGGHGDGALRTWQVGSRHVHGSFHSVRNNDVVIEDAKGRLRVVDMEALSPTDQVYVQTRIAHVASMREPILRHNVAPQAIVPVEVAPPTPTFYVIHLPSIGLTGCAVLLAILLAALAVNHAADAGRLRTVLASLFMLVIVGVQAPSIEASLSAVLAGTDPTVIDATFAPFKPRVATRWDATYFYVEHDGMPMDMPAMKGITAWQQQVPIPQNYRGTNAWSIPLNPVPSNNPVSLDTALHTGAVAIAVNGLPIFNPENNRGEFSYDIGELDAFGGHCGRADDYHYHIAPVHLIALLGNASPIAWALDGYPLYGYAEPDGSDMQKLDANLGHDWNGSYHYHAIKTRPYMIASMRGQITIDRDQVIPQSRATPARPFLQALQGAEITDLHQCDSNHYALKYTVKGSVYWMNYRWTSANAYTYVAVAPDGTRTSTTYQRK